MKEELLVKLTDKNDKAACAFADQIIAESQDSDRWFPFLDVFASLLKHPKSLVRNRALYLLAANARWDEQGQFEQILPDFLMLLHDEKAITVRQCIKALAQLGLSQPQYTSMILSALRDADFSAYKDSMRPLIEKDLAETEALLTPKQ